MDGRTAHGIGLDVTRTALFACTFLLAAPGMLPGESRPAPAEPVRDGRVNVTAYAGAGDGSNKKPWVDALRNALAEHGGQTTYYMPAGHYQDDRTLWIRHNDVRIEGDGGATSIVTTVLYDRTDGSTCWKIAPPPDDTNPRNCITGTTVKGICFRGRGKPTGTALEIEALRRGRFDDISIWRWDGDKENFSNKGIWIRGWDTITFRNVRVYRVPTCIYIDRNPNFPNLDADHFHFQDIYLVAGNRERGVGIEIVAPYVTNITIDGTNAICHVQKGIYIHNRGSGGNGTNISLSDIRVESGSRPGAWGIYVDTDYIVNFLVRNVRIAGGFNGFYFRGAADLTLQNTYVMGGTYFEQSGYVAYDLDAYRDTSLVMINATCNKSRKLGYRQESTVKVADELQMAVGDGLRVYQNGAKTDINGVTPNR